MAGSRRHDSSASAIVSGSVSPMDANQARIVASALLPPDSASAPTAPTAPTLSGAVEVDRGKLGAAPTFSLKGGAVVVCGAVG